MKTTFLTCLLAVVAGTQLAWADPWKDESGHGKWKFKQGWVQHYGEPPPWLRGKGYWDGHFKHGPPPHAWGFQGQYQGHGFSGYVWAPQYAPPPYDYGPRFKENHDDYEEWLEEREERFEELRERGRERYKDWQEDYRERLKDLRERERERFERRRDW